MSNRFVVQRNVSKLDSYIITSHSVSGSKCSLVSFIRKYYNFYYPTFSPLKYVNMFSVYLLLVHNTIKKYGGGGGGGLTVLVQEKIAIPCLLSLETMKIRHFINVRELMRAPMTQEIMRSMVAKWKSKE